MGHSTQAGIVVNRGIVVDDGLETSAPGVFAIGECAEHRGICYGLVQPGYEQADVLARRLAGEEARYPGSILATNLRQNLDEAFVRRLAFTIHFPFPGEEERLRVWRGIWPEQTPLGEDVDLADLARRFKLSGGNIKNVALAAAFLAARGV